MEDKDGLCTYTDNFGFYFHVRDRWCLSKDPVDIVISFIEGLYNSRFSTYIVLYILHSDN